VLDELGVEAADLVTHDIGNMVGYAFAAQHPRQVTRWVAMDAPLPGIGLWDEIPGAMHSAFEQFAAFSQDALDNKAFAAKGKLAMPVLAIGPEKSFGTAQAEVMRLVASDVTAHVVANSGH